jgi:putative hydrolase of the HAD superfamily
MLTLVESGYMGQIEAVLFDYGLVISAPPVPSAWERMKAITGLDEGGLHAGYWKHRHEYDRGTHTGEEFWRLAVAHAGGIVDEQQLAKLIAADIDLWGNLNQPMVDWIWRLQKAGIKTGILSNMGDAMAAGLSAKYPWLDQFHHRVWSYTLKLAKPEAEIYRHAVDGLGVEASHVLFVDDKVENIAAAEAAGLQGIIYGEHDAFQEEMKARGWGALLET